MYSSTKTLIAICLAVACASTYANPAAKLTPAQRVQLAVFGMKAMGLPVSAKDVGKVPNSKETLEMTATGLNLKGHLCATVVSITALKVAGGFEVTCIANRGGTAKKSYTVDSNSGAANEL
jgi:hypothetical protein